MRPYSNDLRKRLLAAVDQGEHSLRQIAQLFHVSLSCLVRLLQRRRATGSYEPKPHGGGRTPKLDAAAFARLRELVAQQPDATLDELRDRLGVDCCRMTLWRALKRLRLTRKKKTLHADQRDRPDIQVQRDQFREELAEVSPDHLVFVDETGATTAMTRTHGRAARGRRVEASAPGDWKRVTLLAGLRPSGVVAPMALVGSTDNPAFAAYVGELLVEELGEGDVVIWDNLQPHQQSAVVAAVEATGARVLPLPPYSPDLNPIEELYSKGKGYLRTVAARTTETVTQAFEAALQRISLTDIWGWFNDRAAYAMHT
jgi:transposase